MDALVVDKQVEFDALEVIKQVENALPKSYKTAMFRVKEFKTPLYRFLETQLVKLIKDNNVTNIVNYIIQKLDNEEKRIDFEAIPNIVENFAASLTSFKDYIQIGANELFNVKQHLIEYIALNYINDNTVKYPTKVNAEGVMEYTNISLEELYLKTIANEYRVPTIQEKQELALDMLSFIEEPEVLSSIIPNIEMTVSDYITKVLPTMLDDKLDVVVGNEIIPINEFVEKLYTYQLELVNGESKKVSSEIEKKEMENNSANSNPNIVGEISLVQGDNEDLLITTEIPVVKSSNPDEEEMESLISNYEKVSSISTEDYYMGQLNRLKDSIAKSTNEHDLQAKENLFNKLCSQINLGNLGLGIQALINSVQTMITTKRNNLIKIASNAEDYIDVLFNRINSFKSEVLSYTSTDEFAKLIGEITSLAGDIKRKGIKDLQLESELVLLRRVANERRLILDAIIPDLKREVVMIKNALEEKLRNIQSDLLKIKHDPNNLGNLVGTKVRLSNNIEEVKFELDNAIHDMLLTDDDVAYYSNKIEKFRSALMSEEKIGYGIR